VNYGAEKCLWLSRDALYRREEGLYRSEAVHLPPVTWWDNEPAVKVIESMHRPAGLLEIIDEAVLYNLTDAYVSPLRAACMNMCTNARAQASGLPTFVSAALALLLAFARNLTCGHHPARAGASS
jgi:hypothetical protein